MKTVFNGNPGPVHYHGTPIWGGAGAVHKVAVRNAGAFVSYVRRDQLKASIEHADMVAIDNGAFSAWKSGKVIDWIEFYRDIYVTVHHEKVSFFVIPDVITGDEHDNDKLLTGVPVGIKDKAIPVWHLHESIDRLKRLVNDWGRVCLGSSGEYAVVRSPAWRRRMDEALMAIGNDRPYIHGLRMLDGRVLAEYPLTSADSTNIACNVPKFTVIKPQITIEACRRFVHYSKWFDPLGRVENAIAMLESCGGTKTDMLVERCAIWKNTIEMMKPPTFDRWVNELRRFK